MEDSKELEVIFYDHKFKVILRSDWAEKGLTMAIVIAK